MSLIGSAPPAAAVPPTRTRTAVRLLPPEEWDRLRDLPFGAAGMPDPASTVLFVAETPDGQIVGVWGIFLQPMLDGLWVDPDYRHTLAASQLLGAMKTFMQTSGVTAAFTQISDGDVMVLAHKAGFVRTPGDLWQLSVPRVTEEET